MKKFSSLIALIFSVSFYFSQEQIIINDIPMIKYEQLENKIKEEKDVVLVLNFWSTHNRRNQMYKKNTLCTPIYHWKNRQKLNPI